MVFLFLILLGLASTGITAPALPAPAAVVNGDRLEVWEAERELAQTVSMSMFHRQIQPERMNELRHEAFNALVLKQLKNQWANDQELQVDLQQIEADWQKVRSRFESDSDYQEALEKKNISDEAFRSAFRRDVVADTVDRYIEDLVAAPPDEDIIFQYLNHKDAYTMPESRHVVHVLVYVSPSASAREKAKAEKRAAGIYEAAQAGKPLLDLVEKAVKGLPPKYNDQLGDLGFVHRGTLAGELDDLVFSAPVGEIVGPVRSLYGYHVFEVLEVKAGQLLPFDEVREAIKASLEKKRRQERLKTFEVGLLEGARIERGPWVEQPE